MVCMPMLASLRSFHHIDHISRGGGGGGGVICESAPVSVLLPTLLAREGRSEHLALDQVCGWSRGLEVIWFEAAAKKGPRLDQPSVPL